MARSKALPIRCTRSRTLHCSPVATTAHSATLASKSSAERSSGWTATAVTSRRQPGTCFSSTYTEAEGQQIHFWGPHDRSAYLAALFDAVEPYLAEADHGLE